jgi:hypothetical protein
MIRKLQSGEYRLYTPKKNPRTGKPRNLGTFKTREEAEQHERDVQFFNLNAEGRVFAQGESGGDNC